MGSLIEREATFRGNIIDHAVNLTTNEFPQFQCRLVAKEIWDEDEKKWVDWTDVEENEITAYLVLYGAKGEIFHCANIRKATGWDGLSFEQLANADLSEVIVQFRTEYNTYKDKTTLQVASLNHADAEPSRSVRKLEASEMKQLDAKYKSMLKNNAGKAAPAKAGAKTPVKKAATQTATEANKGKVTKKNVKSTSPKGPVTKKSTAPPAAPVAPAAPAAAADPEMPAGHCTKQEAWDAIVELKDKSVTDEANAKAYLDAILEVSGANDQDALTDEQWFTVKEIVLEKNAAF